MLLVNLLPKTAALRLGQVCKLQQGEAKKDDGVLFNKVNQHCKSYIYQKTTKCYKKALCLRNKAI